MTAFRLVSYNIHGGIGWDRRFDIDRTLGVLRETEADIIALQEVRIFGPDGSPLLSRLVGGTGLMPISGTVMDHDGNPYGNAVLTRFPIKRVGRVDLSIRGHEPRGALDVELLCHQSPFRLINTHLGLSPWERRAQGQRLQEHFGTDFPLPTALVGDLNGWLLWSGALAQLRRRFNGGPTLATFPVPHPLIGLDRVWVHPASILTGLRVHVSDLSRAASDHYPLVAEVDLC